MLFRHAMAALCLACGIAAIPDGKAILGYRTVSKLEADKINAAGAPIYEADRQGGGGRQTGAGVYTSPNAGDWKVVNGKWVCVFYADQNQLENVVAKIWVPYKVPDTTAILWWTEGSQRDDYIKAFPYNFDPAKSLLMSWVQDKGNQVQLLIPPALIGDAGLAMTAVCKATIAELPDNGGINYDDWQNAIRGDRGDQVTSGDMMKDPDWDNQ